MSLEENDPDDTRTTRSARRSPPTDRLTGRAEYGDPVNPNWRSERTTGRRRRAQAMPSSWQDLLVWLQYGGWRYLAIVGAIVIFAVIGLVFLQGRRPLTRAAPTPAASSDLTLPELPSPTPPISATSQLAPPESSGAQFRVVNTGADGLFLRAEPNTDKQPIKTLPEGAIVTIIGDDSVGPDRVWKHVRDQDGTEGWAASDFLQAAQ